MYHITFLYTLQIDNYNEIREENLMEQNDAQNTIPSHLGSHGSLGQYFLYFLLCTRLKRLFMIFHS